MDAQLQQLVELLTEQNQLLKKYLWRFRFSLLTLLLLTTAICCCLGFIIYTQHTSSRAATVSPYLQLLSPNAFPTPQQPVPSTTYAPQAAPSRLPPKSTTPVPPSADEDSNPFK